MTSISRSFPSDETLPCLGSSEHVDQVRSTLGRSRSKQRQFRVDQIDSIIIVASSIDTGDGATVAMSMYLHQDTSFKDWPKGMRKHFLACSHDAKQRNKETAQNQRSTRKPPISEGS